MANYLLLTEIKTETTKDVEWWMDKTDHIASFQIFDSFETAKAEMRKEITRLAEKYMPCACKNGQYIDVYYHTGDDEDPSFDDAKKVGKIILDTIKDPTYFCEDDDLNLKDTDDSDWYWAYVGTKELIHAEYYDSITKMNVHNMKDDTKNYYFVSTSVDEEGRIVDEISVRLFNDKQLT